MILHIKDLKDGCARILDAFDSSMHSQIPGVSEAVEIKSKGKTLFISITNDEYTVESRIALDEEEDIYAIVKADQFLNLVKATTSETVELRTNENSLIVRGNGEYFISMIYDRENKLIDFPHIMITNEVNSFEVPGRVLSSLLQYNGKEIARNQGSVTKPVHKLYYVDEEGAITFYRGACVNSFTLPVATRFLFNQRLVKMFKMLDDFDVEVTVSNDVISDEITQTKVKFECSAVSITAVINSDEALFQTVPVNSIRGVANKVYPYSVIVDRETVIQAMNRLMILSSDIKKKEVMCDLQFENYTVKISDVSKKNNEKIVYKSATEGLGAEFEYKFRINLPYFKSVLESYSESDIELRFGDERAVVTVCGNIKNVIPQARV